MNEKFDTILDNGQIINLNSNQGWICPKCGTSVSPAAMFCPKCGGKRANESLQPGETMICG